MPRFDLGKIQHVVDEAEQKARAPPYAPKCLALSFCDRAMDAELNQVGVTKIALSGVRNS
ncbi:MAG TPA: hypothetical protein VMN60_09685 [Longimicrobiales bacterium]|nr:hypothetical protein [Longimicrobiales bacterium]